MLADAPQPAIVLKSTAPVTVSGSGFAAGERVRVVAVQGQVRDVVVRRAGPKGALRAVFGDLTADRCTQLVVRAKGATGDRAVVRRPPTMCPPGR